MSERGRSSWGVTDGDSLFKQVGDICDTFVELDLKGPSYHTRAPSCGEVSEANAHPFEWVSEAQNRRVVGMHNGHIANHSDLKTKYAPARDAIQVDSQHIIAHLAEGSDLAELGGYGAVVWYEMPIGKHAERTRFLSTFNSTALSIAKLKSGECVYASTESAITTALKLCGAQLDSFYRIDEKMKYSFSADGSELERHGKLKWGNNVYHTPRQAHQNTSFTPQVHNPTGFRSFALDECMMPGCQQKTSELEIVCGACLQRARAEYQGGTVQQFTGFEGAYISC